MHNLVTVIVPVYNREIQIKKCLESILSSSWKKIEVLVIDDGSTDGTAKIINSFAEADKRIFLITQKNSGVSSARNTGLKHASGDYIVFVDSDDILHPDFIRQHMNMIEQEKSDLVISCKSFENESFKLQGDFITADGQDQIRKSAADYYHSIPINPVWAKMYRRQLIQHLFDENLVTGEDFLFNLSYLKKCQRVTFWKAVMYSEPTSATNSISRNYIKNEFSMQAAVQQSLEGYMGQYLSKDMKMRLFGAAKSCILKSRRRGEKECSITIRDICHNRFFLNYMENLPQLSSKDRIWKHLFQNDNEKVLLFLSKIEKTMSHES